MSIHLSMPNMHSDVVDRLTVKANRVVRTGY